MRALLVYSMAKFYMANPFVYTMPSCDAALIDRKFAQLITAACKQYSGHDRCPFRARKHCAQRRLSEVSSLQSARYSGYDRGHEYCIEVQVLQRSKQRRLLAVAPPGGGGGKLPPMDGRPKIM